MDKSQSLQDIFKLGFPQTLILQPWQEYFDFTFCTAVSITAVSDWSSSLTVVGVMDAYLSFGSYDPIIYSNLCRLVLNQLNIQCGLRHQSWKQHHIPF